MEGLSPVDGIHRLIIGNRPPAGLVISIAGGPGCTVCVRFNPRRQYRGARVLDNGVRAKHQAYLILWKMIHCLMLRPYSKQFVTGFW